MALLPACARDEKVVRYKPFFSGIADAEHGLEPVNPHAGYRDPALYSGESRLESPDGSVRLVSKSIRHLMVHVTQTLDNGEDDVFIEQVLSEQTKQHYRSEGKAAQEAVDYFRRHRREIAILFARMPFGEYSPSVIRRKTGRNQWKLELVAAAKKDSPLTELWVALEDGQYRLIWIE